MIYDNIQKNFCILPWTHYYCSANGLPSLCCIAKPFSSKPVKKVLENWNGIHMRKIRLEMLNGKPLGKYCSKCVFEEKRGKMSKREDENKKYFANSKKDFNYILKKTKKDGSTSLKPISHDLRLGRICNFECLMCSNSQISRIQQNSKINNFLRNGNNLEILKKNIVGIQEVKFGGGEPLMIDYFYELLDYLIKYNSNCKLICVTNGSKITDDVINKFNKFKSVHIRFSIDDIGKRLEFIRYNSKWDITKKNLYKLKNLKYGTSKVSVIYTAQFINIYYFTDFLNYFATHSFGYQINLFVNFLEKPALLSMINLPKSLKNQAILKIDKFLSKKNLESMSFKKAKDFLINKNIKISFYDLYFIKNILKFSNTHSHESALTMIEGFAAKRGMRFYSIFPIFNLYKK